LGLRGRVKDLWLWLRRFGGWSGRLTKKLRERLEGLIDHLDLGPTSGELRFETCGEAACIAIANRPLMGKAALYLTEVDLLRHAAWARIQAQARERAGGGLINDAVAQIATALSEAALRRAVLKQGLLKLMIQHTKPCKDLRWELSFGWLTASRACRKHPEAHQDKS